MILPIFLYVAVVIDTDGSAFITKAEFDSLKNNFQAQIDSYNSSIDSKIDGAIASYLGGIQLISRRAETLECYRAEGIISKSAGDELRWSEGTVNLSFKCEGGYLGVGSGCYQAIYNISWPKAGYALASFKENLVSWVDYSTGKAIWRSNAETKQFVDIVASCISMSSYSGLPWDGVDMYANGWYCPPTSNSSALSSTDLFYFYGAYDSTHANMAQIPRSNDGLRRNTLERTIVSEKYTDICLTCCSLTSDVGFNNIEIRDWCNDYNNSLYTHTDTKTTPLSTAFSYMPYSTTWTEQYRYSQGNNAWTTISKTVWFKYGVQTLLEENRAYQKKPYFGYAKPVNNWNKIYTDAYTNSASAIESVTGVAFETLNAKKCINISQGIPLCRANHGESLVLPVEFKDKTKNYVFWIKRGPFSLGVEPDNETDLVYNGKLDGVQKTDLNKYWSIDGSDIREIEITNNEDDTFYFVKWALATDHTGGGVWLPPQSVEMTSE